MNEQDSIFYINKDHLGSFDVITNPDGSVKERYTYCLNNPLKYSDPSGYSYKAYMDDTYDEGNYRYRGQAPGTWTDWQSYHHMGGDEGSFCA